MVNDVKVNSMIIDKVKRFLIELEKEGITVESAYSGLGCQDKN